MSGAVLGAECICRREGRLWLIYKWRLVNLKDIFNDRLPVLLKIKFLRPDGFQGEAIEGVRHTLAGVYADWIHGDYDLIAEVHLHIWIHY